MTETGGRRFEDGVLLGIVAAALVLGAAVMHLVHKRVDRRREKRANAAKGDLTFRPRPDPGSARIGSGHSPGPDFELRLRPVTDAGVQRIDPPGDLEQNGKHQP